MIRIQHQRADSNDGVVANESAAASSSRQHQQESKVSYSWLAPFFLTLVWTLVCAVGLLRYCHSHYMIPLVQSYERGGDMNSDTNLYDKFDHEFTYYNRRCSAADITTADASDLLVRPNMTGAQAAKVMRTHGAVAFQNVLRNDTAQLLRAYLGDKNKDTSALNYNEVFWLGEDGTRVALALGAGDHAVIRDALWQVGTHATVQRALEGILGPDPAIVEISTLTAKSGCDSQGIHSDSDWFGSSLMYARTFLHSYSFFVALQDTPTSMGATTVCPGSHYCADMDLEAVCLEHGFEVSTNGFTGEDGVLRQGDAFLFNQNVWHRGPSNQAWHQKDRIMFIMTFVSRQDWERGDRRRQGLGTYYYQRWNMWGHTFQDLKHAFVMRQPLAALRALGLYRWPHHKHWGIPWLHQVAQQMANGDDFYTENELADFKLNVVQFYNFPTRLYSAADEWKPFLKETLDLWVKLALHWYAVCAALVLIIQWIVLPLLGTSTSLRFFLKRCFVTHAAVAVTAYLTLQYIASTHLAKTIASDDIFVRPFPANTASTDGIVDVKEPTTFPERSDVLLGTRYDAEFLASFNHFLDGHPGNQVWKARVQEAARLPMTVLQKHAAVEMVEDLHLRGMRFLRQDWATGAWRWLGHEAAVRETQWSIREQSRPLLHHLQTHLRNRLAELRFGRQRDTVWAHRFGTVLISNLQTALQLAEEKTDSRGIMGSEPAASLLPGRLGTMRASITLPIGYGQLDRVPLPGLGARRQLMTRVRQPTRLFHKQYPFNGVNADPNTLMVGERAWVLDDGTDLWYEATLVELQHDDDGEDVWDVEYALGGTQQGVYADSIRQYILFKEGDRVEVDYNRNGEDFDVGTITHVHPNGGCTVLFNEGELVQGIQREYMFLLQAGIGED